MGRTDQWLSGGRHFRRDAPTVPDGSPAVPEHRTDRRRRWLVPLGVTVAYAAIAVAAYLPTLPLDGWHTQICTCGDTAQDVWFLGWVPFALSHGHSLFYTNWILYPAGVNLMDNTAMTGLGLAAAPITLLAGPIAAYNLVLRAGFTLSALAMFITVRRLVRWWPAAFLAGLLYGFSPFMVGQGLSHEFLVFAPIPPLVFGIMADVLGRQRMPARRAGLLLGVLFAAQFLIASETFVMMAFFTGIGTLLALCYRRAREQIGHVLKAGAWAVGACAVAVAYPVYIFFAGPQHIVGPPHSAAELYTWHGDVLGALLPTPLMRFAPAALMHAGAGLVDHNLQENGTYLGAPLVLVAVWLAVAFRRRPVTAISGVLAVVSYALSLGPRIYVANHSTGLPGPFAALTHVPVLQDVEPARFSLFTALFVAVVLGTGLSELRFPRPAVTDAPPLARTAASHGRLALAAAIGLVALLPLVPNWPYPAGPVVTPRLFTTSAVGRLPAGAVIVTLPFPARQSNEALVWQAEASMRFRLVGGSPFFVPGPGQRSVITRVFPLRPPGIDQVFSRALYTPSGPGGNNQLQRAQIAAIRLDLRHYHVSAILIDPLVSRGLHRYGYGMPPAAHLGTPPGLRLAVRYVTAATGHPPQLIAGMLCWLRV
jgi:hypothetical protein